MRRMRKVAQKEWRESEEEEAVTQEMEREWATESAMKRGRDRDGVGWLRLMFSQLCEQKQRGH